MESFHLMNRILYKAQSENSVWGEHELDHVFIVKNFDEIPEKNSNEVQQIKFVSAPEMKKILANFQKFQINLTPWFKLILEEFLFVWWSRLENLPPTEEKIYNFSKKFL